MLGLVPLDGENRKKAYRSCLPLRAVEVDPALSVGRDVTSTFLAGYQKQGGSCILFGYGGVFG